MIRVAVIEFASEPLFWDADRGSQSNADWHVKTGESGNKREQTFCPDCGTPIYSAPIGEGAKVLSMRVGAIKQRDQLIPADQFWFRSAQKWLSTLPTIKKMETQPVFGPRGGFSR
jgi:hypothetical protein